MAWSKVRRPVRYDMAGSNLLGCTVEDLPGCLDAVRLSGLNPYGYPPLIEAIANRYGVSTEQVATASGAGGANFLVLAALVEAGDEVLIERPAYDPMLGALRFLGARITRFDRTFEEGWQVDPERVTAALSPATRLVLLTSPHNPSGALVPQEVLRAIGRAADRVGAYVLVDEVYLEGVYGDRPPPAATLGQSFISTNSLTKAYGLSGLRAGWALASPEVTRRINRTRDVMDGVGPIPADTLAVHAFTMLDRLEARARSILEPNLETVTRFIEGRADLDWVRPHGGSVVFPRVRGVQDTSDLADRLETRYDTAIVPGEFFDSPAHFRIAFGIPADIVAAGLERLGLALDEIRAEAG